MHLKWSCTEAQPKVSWGRILFRCSRTLSACCSLCFLVWAGWLVVDLCCHQSHGQCAMLYKACSMASARRCSQIVEATQGLCLKKQSLSLKIIFCGYHYGL